MEIISYGIWRTSVILKNITPNTFYSIFASSSTDFEPHIFPIQCHSDVSYISMHIEFNVSKFIFDEIYKCAGFGFNPVIKETYMVCTLWSVIYFTLSKIVSTHTDRLVQERHNSIANALELHLSWTNPLILWYHDTVWLYVMACVVNLIALHHQ